VLLRVVSLSLLVDGVPVLPDILLPIAHGLGSLLDDVFLPAHHTDIFPA
jgi:hypothetical protein